MPVFSGIHGNNWTICEMKMLAYLMEKGLEPEGEVAAGMSNNKVDNQPVKSLKAWKTPFPAIKMNIEQAHTNLGHSSKDAMRQIAAALDMLIMRGAL